MPLKLSQLFVILTTYFRACIQLRVLPWRFFGINQHGIHPKKGVFCKSIIQNFIPPEYQLPLVTLGANEDIVSWQNKISSLNYPVIIKPDLGQNSKHIHIAYNSEDKCISKQRKIPVDFVAQQVATGIEYDILFISNEVDKNYSLFSIVELSQPNMQEKIPIHGIYQGTQYKEINHLIEPQKLRKFAQKIQTEFNFKFARIGVKAQSLDDLLNFNFKTIEVNLFLPLCLNVLDTSISEHKRISFLKYYIYTLIVLTKHYPNPFGFWQAALLLFKSR